MRAMTCEREKEANYGRWLCIVAAHLSLRYAILGSGRIAAIRGARNFRNWILYTNDYVYTREWHVTCYIIFLLIEMLNYLHDRTWKFPLSHTHTLIKAISPLLYLPIALITPNTSILTICSLLITAYEIAARLNYTPARASIAQHIHLTTHTRAFT